jgi:putative SOS response-associated peptidase YedK
LPVILKLDEEDRWLAGDTRMSDGMKRILQSFPAGEMDILGILMRE